MKILIGLPSYNEAKNISYVTHVVDEGLKKLASVTSLRGAVIVNVDSSSQDSTVREFLDTETCYNKRSIVVEGSPGKGKNVFEFLKYGIKEEGDLFLLFDSDIKSMHADWIVKMANSLIENDVDFVFPRYKRNRFEGSTTNHFAYPVVYGLGGYDMRQPIAGDFGLSKNFAKFILESKIPQYANYYGVDIYLSLNAVLNNFVAKEVFLERKIHNPSFGKMTYMFPQIASTLLDAIKDYDFQVFSSEPFMIKGAEECCTDNVSDFSHKEEAERISLVYKKEMVADCGKYKRWFGDIEKYKGKILEVGIDCDLWVQILMCWIMYFLQNKDEDSFCFAQELLPFFFIHVVSFWQSIQDKSAEAVEQEIILQAQHFQHNFSNNNKICTTLH